MKESYNQFRTLSSQRARRISIKLEILVKPVIDS